MLSVEMLPAACGDCLWIEYGGEDEPGIVVVDGGVKDTAGPLAARIRKAAAQRHTSALRIELLVVTHIDNDHIEGILELLRQSEVKLELGDVWFNGTRQLVGLPPDEEERVGVLGADDQRIGLLGFDEGDELSKLLAARRLPWNDALDGAAIGTRPGGRLPEMALDGGLVLTVLGPSMARLRKLADAWPSVRDGIDLEADSGDSRPGLLGRGDVWPPEWGREATPDTSKANASSIVLLLEHDRRALLLAGDAWAPDLETGIGRLCRQRALGGAPFPLSAFKLPHHGSARNLSRTLIEQVRCDEYLISTDGSTHKHPDHLALLRVIAHGGPRPRLRFNYEADTTRDWRLRKDDVVGLLEKEYEPVMPAAGERGLTTVLEPPPEG